MSLAVPFALSAQSAPPGAERRWEVVWALGMPFGGPASDLEEGMRAAGWDRPLVGKDYPSSSGGDLSHALSIRRSVTPRLGIEVVVARAFLGRTTGNREALGFGFLPLDHTSLTLAPVLSWRAGGWHAGAGPSFNRVRVSYDALEGGRTDEAWQPGILAETGIGFPREGRLFLDLRAQYRFVLRHSVGSFTVAHPHGEEPAVLPATEIDASHSAVWVGVGVRL